MVIRIVPDTSNTLLDIVIAEQAAYYGQINAHIIAFYRSKC